MTFYDKYGLILFFIVSVACIFCLFIYNCISGAKGTYNDHTKLIWNLINSPGVKEKQKPKTSSGELECRRAAEKLTGHSFPKHRPSFLRNSVTDSNLELDCYCPELHVAIEYNGRQHYEYTPYFHSSRDAFNNTRYRDEMKARLCKENGVSLIIVPYTIPNNQIEEYLERQFVELGIL